MEVIAAVGAVVAVGAQLADVITKLHKFLQDAKADLDIKEDVESLNKELQWMQGFLKDAENKPGRNSHLFKIWVDEVRQLVIRCEDVADKISQAEPSTHTGCLSLRAKSCCFISYNKTDLHRTTELSCQIKKLLSDIRDVASRRERYDPNADAGNTSGSKIEDEKLRERRRQAPYANEYVVGLHETIQHLTTKLLDGDSGSFVICILGMGGLGKTTIARKLYNILSKQNFDSSGWVCVTVEYNTREILMSLINSMIKPSKVEREGLTDISSMEAYLHDYLSGRRFLVVVDDVWERAAWESLERAFPDNNNGSKVIITTRKDEVAALNNACIHKLRYLKEDESWELFCIKVLPRGTECPSNLIQVGKEMVAKCSGLPLAIVVLGGILLKKPLTSSKWRAVRDNLWKELEGSDLINATLTLSYKDLPGVLRQCFLYVAMFPEDFEISISYLMLLWEAEGFITTDGDGCAGDVAKSYFDELLGRNLFSKTCGDWIESKFRVHDLLRDLAILKARETGFSLYYDDKGTFDISKAPFHKRLAVFHRHGIPVGYTNSSLHTFCVREVSKVDNPCPSSHTPYHELFPKLHEKFEKLRVLDIQMSIEAVPNTIGMLIHLRYLGIFFDDKYRFGGEHELPDTIGNLKSLQTLAFTAHGKVALPETVLKLTQLKHLIFNVGSFVSLSDKICSLICLETLSVRDQWCRLDTTKLGNLRRLLMFVTEGEIELERFYNNFKNLVKLQTLTLRWFSTIDISVEKVFEMCPSISHLETFGISFSNSLGLDRFAVNLEVLEIYITRMGNSNVVISAIEKLPQLEALRLCSFVNEPYCFKEGFAQLRTLEIKAIRYGATKVTVMEGCMPLLEHLTVNEPSKFQGPDRLMRLINRC